jgi:hypothetical protein
MSILLWDEDAERIACGGELDRTVKLTSGEGYEVQTHSYEAATDSVVLRPLWQGLHAAQGVVGQGERERKVVVVSSGPVESHPIMTTAKSTTATFPKKAMIPPCAYGSYVIPDDFRFRVRYREFDVSVRVAGIDLFGNRKIRWRSP